MDISEISLTPAVGSKEQRSLRKAISLGLRLAIELLRVLAFLFLIIFTVSLVSNLTQEGAQVNYLDLVPQSISAAWLFTGELISGQIDISENIPQILFRSMGLLLIGVVPGTVFGVFLGGLAAMRPKSRLSTALVTSSILGISTPSYIVAMFLIWSVVAFYQSAGTRLLPVAGFGWDAHMILPMLVLATQPAAQMMRLTYATLHDVFGADYIRTAYGKGLRERRVFWGHALRNAGVPLLTSALVSLQFSLSMLPVVEYIFNWPGIGLALLQSVQAGNLGTATVLLLPLAIVFLGASALLRLSYSVIDPRLKDSQGGVP